MRNVHPNTISLLALIIAALAGIMLFFSDRWDALLVFAALAVLVSGFFDGLDGKVARLSGKTSKKGDFVDHVLDPMPMCCSLALSPSAAVQPSMG